MAISDPRSFASTMGRIERRTSAGTPGIVSVRASRETWVLRSEVEIAPERIETVAEVASRTRLAVRVIRCSKGAPFKRPVALAEICMLGRDIRTRHCAKGVAWFDFSEICDGPRSQNDYIEIARWYQTVIISDVPVLNSDLEDLARRFISMVDEFYDRRVKLILSAEVGLDKLYQGTKLAFEFRRTESRLSEMQSADYLHKAHIA